jgi:hypothetical protein
MPASINSFRPSPLRFLYQCWWRRSKPARDTSMDAPADSADNATISAAAHYLHAPDSLVLELCVASRVGRPNVGGIRHLAHRESTNRSTSV